MKLKLKLLEDEMGFTLEKRIEKVSSHSTTLPKYVLQKLCTSFVEGFSRLPIHSNLLQPRLLDLQLALTPISLGLYS